MPEHVVSQGECLLSISEHCGFHWQTVWDHPQNASLRQLRESPYVLHPGDVVFIPDKALRLESCATDSRHRFLRKGVPAVLRLQLLDRKHRPRPNLKYIVDVDGVSRSGTADAEGYIVEPIAPGARAAILTVEENGKQETYRLALGHVDPVTEPSGVRQRLLNLGFNPGPGTGVDEAARAALRAFQKQAGLPATGEADPATCERLKQIHGC